MTKDQKVIRAKAARFNDTTAAFSFPAVGRKKLTAAFDGGSLASDGDGMLLAVAERRHSDDRRKSASD